MLPADEIDTLGLARQVAALAWRSTENGPDILLVTSRISRHWLLPKGWPMPGKIDCQSALQEAFEEAGVEGTAGEQPIGTYRYDKILKNGSAVPCLVDVFALHVTDLLDDWPESAQRERRWFNVLSAAEQVAEPDLARFLRQCEALLPAIRLAPAL